ATGGRGRAPPRPPAGRRAGPRLPAASPPWAGAPSARSGGPPPPGGLPVALKFVPRHAGARAERRALDILKQVRHPHLLATVGAWQQGEHLIIAMELADRTPLDRLHEAV